MKGSCSTEPRSPLWKPSVLTTLTGEFVEAMELAMERVCRKWLCVLAVYLDSPDTRTIKVLKALAIGGEGGGGGRNWYYDLPSLWRGQGFALCGGESLRKVLRELM